MLLPKTSNTGSICLKTFSSPPTIIDNVPFLAPISPPDTGASRLAKLCFEDSSKIFFANNGLDVVKSMRIQSFLALAIIPLELK